MALPRRKRATAPERPADPEPEVFPPWAISSVMEFLGPFLRGQGYETGYGSPTNRSFLREVERNLRQPLDWRHGEESAARSLLGRCDQDPSLLVDIVDFALRNVLLGTYIQNSETAARELDRALRESGAAWRVGEVEGTLNYRLERRADPAAHAAVNRLAQGNTQEGQHLSAAWDAAYGRNPNPSHAYGEAIKAVEESAVPVVLPNDRSATLGKVIGELRATPSSWECIFTRDSRMTPTAMVTPIEVVIGMLDLLWANQTDRHAPITPVTQEQAESAVQFALALVELFRSGAISRR